MAHEHGAVIHCDAAQAVGKIPADVLDWDIDFLSLSGHKMYGPKGIGALFVRNPRLVNLEPVAYGGGQERNWRSGTLNVPGIVGLGEACRLCYDELPEEQKRLAALRNDFERQLVEAVPTAKINGARHNRLPNNSNVTFDGIEADVLLANMPDIALSSGSACDSGTWQPSPTLTAIGHQQEELRSTIRVGFGRFNTACEIEQVVQKLAMFVRHLGG